MTVENTERSGAVAGFTTGAVVGAGLMGRRLAGVLAGGGLAVRLFDSATGILDEAVSVANELAAERAAAAGVSPGTVVAAPSLEECVADVDLVVEAVIENLALKQELFERISAVNTTGVLATNTSVLPVSAVAERVADPSRMVGTHWWNPPDLVPVVEVVLGQHSDPAVADRVVALLDALGKLPVLVKKDVPGFVGNRLQHALWREAFALVSEGVADAETVDLVVRNTIGLRLAQMGPIETADYVGLDMTIAIHEAVLPGLSTDSAPNPLLYKLAEQGHLGAKTGRGFYQWPEGERARAASGLAAHVAGQVADQQDKPHPSGAELD